MAAHAQLVEELKKATARLLDAINEDGQLSDEEAAVLIDVEQWIAEKFGDTFERYGVEIGDERVD